ncbi:MAG: hypothetical protein R3B13_32550 [Polyangiaceae bacterium]
MRSTLISASLFLAPWLTACGSDVPIGSGQSNVNGAGGGGQAGAAGSAGSAGEGARPGMGGAGGSGATSSGGAASGGASGSAGTSGSAGSGGSTATCPVDSSAVQRTIAAKGARDTLIVSNTVFFTETVSATDTIIRRVQLPGGAVEAFGSAAQFPAQASAFDATDSLVSVGGFLYWRAKSGNEIWRQSFAGGAPTLIASVTGSFAFSQYGTTDMLAIAGTDLYWAQGPEPVFNSVSDVEYTIYRAPIGGGTPTKVTSYQSDGVNLPAFVPTSMHADSTDLWFSLTGAATSEVWRLPLAGGAAAKLPAAGSWIALTANDVLATAGPVLLRAPKSGSSAAAVWAVDTSSGYGLFGPSVVVGNGSVYASYLATVVQGSTVIQGCSVILNAPASATMATPKFLWQGKGHLSGMSYSPGALAVTVESDGVMILKP